MTRDEDAIALDRYLDALLAGEATGPEAIADAHGLDDDLSGTARALSRALTRFHPSFRFEERLAGRLRAAALVSDVEAGTHRSSGPGVVIPFAAPGRAPRSRSRRVNGALIGGAISAGVSLASLAAGAIVARRRSRGDGRWERVI